MDLGLTGKIAIVGGSSKGIGLAVAQSLVREGSHVTIVARHGDELEAAASKLRAKTHAGAVLNIVGDLSNPKDILRVFDETIARWRRVDIVINNLGGPPAGELMDFSDDQWQSAFDLNFSSAMRMNRLALPGMIERGHGRIIAVLSKAIKEPEDRLGLSTVARSALSSYSKLLAQEVAGNGITVNNVLPGSVATERLRSVIAVQATANNRTIDEQEAFRLASVPAARFGDPSELGDLIAFLASDRAGFITAQNIAVDGGQIKGLSA